MEIPYLTEAETLPNGVHIHKLVVDGKYIASIRIGPWYYCQGGETKELAVKELFCYMRRMKVSWHDQLQKDIERLKTLDEFLVSENESKDLPHINLIIKKFYEIYTYQYQLHSHDEKYVYFYQLDLMGRYNVYRPQVQASLNDKGELLVEERKL
jgi:hypothetical protein